MSEFRQLGEKVLRFARARDWEQFHSPKNLSMALAVESAELMEHFQWLTQSQSRQLTKKQLREVEKELADVQIYLIRLSQVLDVDLVAACESKLVHNARKYPISKARGSMKKYTAYRKQ